MPGNRFDDINTSSVDSFFAHHGIKGQKWGVRRYQNADGTLTDEGRKRYSKGEGKKSSNGKDKKPKTIADEIAQYSISGKKDSGYKIDPRLQLGKEYTVRDDVIKYYMNIDKTVTDPIREHNLKFEADKNRKQFKTSAIAAAGGLLAIETGIGAAYGVSGAIPGVALGAGIGAGVGAVNAASIGIAAASRVHKANKADKQLESVISEINSNKKVDKKTGLKLIQGEHSEEDDLSKVNPGYKNFSETTKNNCMLCTTTYDLRRRGYDVTVNGTNDGYYEGTMMSWYKGNAKLKVLESSSSTSKKYKELQALPEGSRGNLCVQWKQGGGHSMFFEIKDGDLVIRDGQTNKTYTGGKAKQILSETRMCKYVRLDNLDPNIPAMKKSGVFYMGETSKKTMKHVDAIGISFDDILDSAASIEHHGIKGQKWGLRRFQYDDGTLTPEGRKRYLKGGDRAIRKAEKIQSKREKILSDRKKLYKHRNEFSKEELDKAMERFASQDRLREQMQASKEAKRQDRAENKRSRLEFKRLKMQQKQMKEQEKQAKLATEQKKLETEQKNEVAEAQTRAAKWRERANKARSIYDFAKVGQDILSDIGITSKDGNDSLFGAIAEAVGIKDNSKAKAAAERKKRMAQETEDLNLEKLRWNTQTAKASAIKNMRSLNEDAPEPSKDTSASRETKNETTTSTEQTPRSALSALLGSGSSSSNDEIPHVKGEFVKPKKEKKEKRGYNGFVDILDPEQAKESFGSVPMNEVFAIMKSKGYI